MPQLFCAGFSPRVPRSPGNSGTILILAVVLSSCALSVCASTGKSFFSSITKGWAYDVTVAFIIAVIWWFAEFASSRSQTSLYFCSDWNFVWSIVSIILLLCSIFAFIFEVYLSNSHGCSLPGVTSTLIASSLSYIIEQKRFRMFDGDVKLLQQLLRMRKLRFGSEQRGHQKYVIVWFRWKKGDPDNSWKIVEDLSMKNVMVEWGIGHRIGNLSTANVSGRVRGREDSFWGLIGSLLYYWLPSLSFDYLNVRRWENLEALKAAYRGGRGDLCGCNSEEVPFSEWLKKPSEEHFQLVAMEFREATVEFMGKLPEIVKKSESARETADLFVQYWNDCIQARLAKQGRTVQRSA